MYFNASVYTYLYVFTLCLFYFFAAVAQNHFPQLGISPAARWIALCSPFPALSLCLFICGNLLHLAPHCVG